jgi:hypothetical protein
MLNNTEFDDKSKTKKGREEIMVSLSHETINGYLLKRDIECWQLYNNTGDVKEFEYLRKIGNFELPSKIRRTPVQRAKANSLISQKARKRSKFEIRVTDKMSVLKKNERIFHMLAYMTGTQLVQKRSMIEQQVLSLDQQLGELQQMINVEPKTQEEAAQIEMVQRQLPFITLQINSTKESLGKGITLAQDELDKIDKYLKEDYQDIIEEYGEKLNFKLGEELDIHRKSTDNFINFIVSGRQYYYVDYEKGNKKPTYETPNGLKVIYPFIEGIRWTQHGPWVGYNEYMSKEQIRKSFNLDNAQLNTLKGMDANYSSSQAGMFVVGPGHAVVFDQSGENSTANNQYVNKQVGIEVKRRWWKAQKKLTAMLTPNKYVEGKHFINFIKDKRIISTDDFRWDGNNRYYVSRTNKDEFYQKNEVVVYNPNKGEKIETRFFEVRYRGATIGNGNEIVLAEEDPVQPRYADDYTQVVLPIVGRTYSGVQEYPYSIFWATRELQKQYWVVQYFRELTFALAGAAGVVFDMSQKPDGMSDDEWFYQMKMGRYLIQTISKTGAKKNTGYNQFSRVDQTLPASIQYFETVLSGLDFQIGQIMGVPRQRLGEVVASDQVGTFEQSNEQSHLVTEILFYEHDEIESEARKLLLNVAAQYVYEPGDILDIPGELVTTITIPEYFDTTRFDMSVKTSVMNDVKVKELKQIANIYAQKGVVPFEFIAKIFDIDSLKEIQREVESMVQKQREIASLQAQQGIQAESEAKQKETQLAQQFESQMKMIDARLEEAGLKMTSMLEQQKLILENKKITLADQREKEKNAISAQDTEDEFQVENRIISENQRSNVMQERLKALELQIEAITNKDIAGGSGDGNGRMPEHVIDN